MSNKPQIKAMLLAAGVGSRLLPLTYDWPKCLMPIGKRPLLDYWLETLYRLEIVDDILVNLHHHSSTVKKFLSREKFSGWVSYVYEEKLLGTAGTLLANKSFFEGSTILLVHADNWCQCNFKSFLNYHINKRPKNSLISMMTFETDIPESCGIVEIDKKNLVTNFFEKVSDPPSNLANAAIYLLEPEVLSWLEENQECIDFSTQVLPNFINRISTWHNTDIHRDIGLLANLRRAQLDKLPESIWLNEDDWQKSFLKHPIHDAI